MPVILPLGIVYCFYTKYYETPAEYNVFRKILCCKFYNTKTNVLMPQNI